MTPDEIAPMIIFPYLVMIAVTAIGLHWNSSTERPPGTTEHYHVVRMRVITVLALLWPLTLLTALTVVVFPRSRPMVKRLLGVR